MGSDLLLYYAPIPAEPTWALGEERIAQLTAEDADDAALSDDLDEARAQLLADLTELRRVVEGSAKGEWTRRDIDVLTIGGREYLFTGGMSSGDTPTDFADVMNHLGQTGVLDAVGFTEAESNAITLRLP